MCFLYELFTIIVFLLIFYVREVLRANLNCMRGKQSLLCNNKCTQFYIPTFWWQTLALLGRPIVPFRDDYELFVRNCKICISQLMKKIVLTHHQSVGPWQCGTISSWWKSKKQGQQKNIYQCTKRVCPSKNPLQTFVSQ